VNALYSQRLVRIVFFSLYIASMCKASCGYGLWLRIGMALEAGIIFWEGVIWGGDWNEVMVMVMAY